MDGQNGLPAESVLSRLSERERELYLLFLQDLTLKDIAHRMGISASAAATLKRRVMNKLEVLTDFRLFLLGIRHGLIDAHGAQRGDDDCRSSEPRRVV